MRLSPLNSARTIADSSCEKGQAEWNVPPGTVTSITIYPQIKLMLSDLRINLNRFEKFINPHNPDSVSYNNEEEGISIGTRSNGAVVVVQYLPAAKDNYLRCPNASTHQLSNNEMQYYKFDEYSNIPFSDEKARLDNFAATLHNESNFKGYLIVYAGRHTRAGEAKARADRAKSYLVNERGIESGRVVTIDGGYREKPMGELYLLPRDVSPPIATPTVDPSEVQIIKVSSTKNNNRRSSLPHRKRRPPCQ